MSGALTPSPSPSTSASAAQVLEWASAFQARPKDPEKTHLSCYVRSFEANEKNPFEFTAKQGFLSKFFFRIRQAVKSFLGLYSFNLDVQLEKFVSITENFKEKDLQGYLQTSGKKTEEVFTSVRELFDYLETNGQNTKAYKKLLEAKHLVGNVFAEHILSSGKVNLENMKVGISESGEIKVFLENEGYTKDAFFQKIKISDQVLQQEIWNRIGVQISKNEEFQKLIRTSLVELYDKECSSISAEMSKYSPGWIVWRAPKVTPEAIQECSGIMEKFENAHHNFLEKVGNFFADGGGFITQETLETITEDVNRKYQETWNKLDTGTIIRFSLSDYSLQKMSGFMEEIGKSLKVDKDFFENEISVLKDFVEQVKKRAEKIEKSVAKEEGDVAEAVRKKADGLIQLCSKTLETVSKLVPMPAESIQKREKKEALQSVIDNPCVRTALKVADTYQVAKTSEWKSIAGAVLKGVAPAAIGIALVAVTGTAPVSLPMMLLGMAGGIVVQPLVKMVGTKVGLREDIAETLGMIASFAFTVSLLRYSAFYCSQSVVPLPAATPAVPPSMVPLYQRVLGRVRKVFTFFAQAERNKQVEEGQKKAWSLAGKIWVVLHPQQTIEFVSQMGTMVASTVASVVSLVSAAVTVIRTRGAKKEQKSGEKVS